MKVRKLNASALKHSELLSGKLNAQRRDTLGDREVPEP